jgi:UDP-galactopyranose mutase
LVHIADTAEEFVAACEAALDEDTSARQEKVDAFLAQTSWDGTWASMGELIDAAVAERRAKKFATASASGVATFAC